MSAFTPPPPAPNTNPLQPANPSGARKGLLIAFVLLGLLTAVNVAFYFLKKGDAAGAAPLKQMVSDKDQALAELNQKYAAATAQMDSIKAANPAAEGRIEALQSELEHKRADIEASIRLQGDLQTARQQIVELIAQKDAAVLEATQLKDKVVILNRRVETLSSENEQLNYGIADSKAQLEREQTAKDKLLADKKELERVNLDLQNNLNANMYLSVRDVQATAMSVSKKGKETDTHFAKKAEGIRVRFIIAPNPVVQPGEETFQIKITEPAGTTLYQESQKSGVSRERGGEEFRYSTVAVCQYSQVEAEASATWSQEGQRLAKGTYTVTVYNRGRKVGEGSFKVK